MYSTDVAERKIQKERMTFLNSNYVERDKKKLYHVKFKLSIEVNTTIPNGNKEYAGCKHVLPDI